MKALFIIEVDDDRTSVRTQASTHGVPAETLDAAIEALRHERANVHKCPRQRACDSDRNPQGEDPQGLRAQHESAGRDSGIAETQSNNDEQIGDR